MKVDLLIDGNYILTKLVYTLHKNNLLFGSLYQSLENTLNNYRKIYPFSNIYLVSDSKEKSWRKKLLNSYKSNRKKDSDIDWIFVYNVYTEFKESIKDKIKILEYPHIEGDDWISFLSEKANNNGRSTIIVSNDYDIKQIIKYNINPLYINIMINEMLNKEKIFLPKNYQIFINEIIKLPNDDIFNLNNNNDFILLLNKFIDNYEIIEIDSSESLLIKVISGDQSDNVKSVWSQTKNDKTRGIGIKGAKSIYDTYTDEFGDTYNFDEELFENIADIICDKKKLSKNEIPSIVENIKYNMKLINLNLGMLPQDIVNTMEKIYNDKNR